MSQSSNEITSVRPQIFRTINRPDNLQVFQTLICDRANPDKGKPHAKKIDPRIRPFQPAHLSRFRSLCNRSLAGTSRFRRDDTPSGTLTDSSGPLTFTAGPYLVANRSSQATGTPTCNSILICEEYPLTVSGLSAATTASKYIRIEFGWPELGEAQFDLYVFAGTTATGNVIAKSIGNQTYVDPDVVLIPAINGT